MVADELVTDIAMASGVAATDYDFSEFRRRKSAATSVST